MSQRVYVTLDDATFQALQAAAAQRASRPTTIAGEIITTVTMRHAPGPPGQLEIVAAAAQSAPAPSPAPPAPAPIAAGGENRAAWLQLDRGDRWREQMWVAAQQLRQWYPDLAELLRDGWHTDRFALDGTLALAVWRAELDEGEKADPRLEHQWLAALRDFKRMLEDRQGHIGSRSTPQPRPEDW